MEALSFLVSRKVTHLWSTLQPTCLRFMVLIGHDPVAQLWQLVVVILPSRSVERENYYSYI